MDEEQNTDLPRPRNRDYNYNLNSRFHVEYEPDPEVLYDDPEEESGSELESIPELRRAQTRRFPAQKENPSPDPAQHTLRLRKSSQAQYFDNTSEENNYYPGAQDDTGYGAYEAYDMPERQTRKERTPGRTVKANQNSRNNNINNNSKKSGKSGSSRKSGNSAPRKSPAKSRKKSPGGGILKRLLRKILVLALILFGIYSAVALLLISKLEKIPRMPRTVTSGSLDAGYVQNILLIGTDARDITTERGRSDTILLLSMNSMTEKMYLTSFMRDAYVEIPGHGSNKLNAAYAYGGAELLMDTLEQNYQISIDDYLCVSFMGFAGIIDAFGGVEIDVSDAEAQAVNEILQSEVNALAGDDIMSDFLDKGGKFILNGKQALSYARIRYVGNADFERTSRQREVMTQIFQNVKSKAVTAVPELISSALPHVGANMSTMDLYLLSLKAPMVVSYDIEQLQIPANGTYTPADIDGQSVLQVDFNANTQLLEDTVYALPEPTDSTQSDMQAVN